MKAYAIAHLSTLRFGPEIVEYLERIDDTLEPFGGRFLVHGARPDVREPGFEGHLIVLEFPDRERATAWYESDAYVAILPLRTRNAEGWAVLVDGVPDGYRASDLIRRTRETAP